MNEFVHTNERIHADLESGFLIMKVNKSDENENAAFLSNYPQISGYPHFFVLDQDGTFLHSQETGELEAGRGYDEESFASFLKTWAPQ